MAAAGEGVLAAPGAGSLRLVRVEGFEAPEVLASGDEDAYRRRFCSLLMDDARSRRGGLGQVTWAVNARGEALAVKRLLPAEGAAAGSRECQEALERAFAEEYEGHRRVSGLKGFPRLYGRGTVDGAPALIMEWVEGETLEHAARALAVDGEGRLSPLTAARISRDLFELLARMDLVEGGFSHRDVTPANVMVCTTLQPLAAQVEEGVFDLRLVDFGSAAVGERRATSLTEAWGAPRGATPEYAPPEMLTEDVAEAVAARAGAAVDVYAAAGVAQRLLTGRPPFDLASDVRSPYRCKTEDVPAPLTCAHEAAADLGAVLAGEPEVAVALSHAVADAGGAPGSDRVREALCAVDAQLAGLVGPCLASKPKDRPSAAAVRDGLTAFCRQYAPNLGRALRGEPLDPAVLGEGATRVADRSRRAAAVLRGVACVACGLVWAAVLVSAALLADGARATVATGAGMEDVLVPGWAVALLLAAPTLAAYAARGRNGDRGWGFAAGSAVLAGASLLVMGAGVVVDLASGEVASALAAALAACAAAAWCPMAIGYALSPRRRRARAERRAARDGLPAGEDDAQDGAEPLGLAS